MKENLFAYYNPNPIYKPLKNGKNKKWNRGDCSIRAICAATGMTWIDAYRFAFESALKVFDVPNFNAGFEQVMKDLGFEKKSYKTGQKRETVNEFANNHKDVVAILRLSGHYVCCKNGHYFDTWDCGCKTAYNYWVKK